MSPAQSLLATAEAVLTSLTADIKGGDVISVQSKLALSLLEIAIAYERRREVIIAGELQRIELAARDQIMPEDLS